MMDMTNSKPLVSDGISAFEYEVIWMAIRYAVGKNSISCVTLPYDLVKNVYHRFTRRQRIDVSADIMREMERIARFKGAIPVLNNDVPSDVDNEFIDKSHVNVWLKFAAALNDDEHVFVRVVDNAVMKVFRVGDRYYVLDDYLKEPHRERYIPLENIIGEVGKYVQEADAR